MLLVVEHQVGGDAAGDLAVLIVVDAVVPQAGEHVVEVELRIGLSLLASVEVAVSAGVGHLAADQHVGGGLGVGGQGSGDLGRGVIVAAGVGGVDDDTGVQSVEVLDDGHEGFAAGAAQGIPDVQSDRSGLSHSHVGHGENQHQSQYQRQELVHGCVPPLKIFTTAFRCSNRKQNDHQPL